MTRGGGSGLVWVLRRIGRTLWWNARNPVSTVVLHCGGTLGIGSTRSELKEIAYELPINSAVSSATRQRSDRLGIGSTHALQKRQSTMSIDKACSMSAISGKRGKCRPWCDMNRVAYCLEVIFRRRVRQSVPGLKVLLPSRPPPPLA